MKLSALGAEVDGQTATIQIADAEAPEKVVATLVRTFVEGKVEASWTGPTAPPPHAVTFTVEAAGQKAESGVLRFTRNVTIKLVLDGEPAPPCDVILVERQSGDTMRGTSDDRGVIVFEDAPSGEWALRLDEDD